MSDDIDVLDIQNADVNCAGAIIGDLLHKLYREKFVEPNHEVCRLLDDAYNLCFVARRIYNRSQQIKRKEERERAKK